MTNLIEWPTHRLFPYEVALANRELVSLTSWSGQVGQQGTQLVLPGGEGETRQLVERSTYFRGVRYGERLAETEQSLVESNHRRVRNRSESRQATRYLVHDFHEYKGKFNPQMARALINVFGAGAETVVDPFCGSGTTLVEALRLGKRAVGIDKSAFAIWLSRIKLDVLSATDRTELQEQFHKRVDAVLRLLTDSGTAPEAVRLRSRVRAGRAAAVQTYLDRWFQPHTLADLDLVLGTMSEDPNLCDRLLALAVSNIVREVSWQLPVDLRVRRRSDEWVAPEVLPILAKALARLQAGLTEVAHMSAGIDANRFSVLAGDASDIELAEASQDGSAVVITSPPYATALPYIDTDRLSMVLLDLLYPAELRDAESQLTGSREWVRGEGGAWRSRLGENADGLPAGVLELADRITNRNEQDGAGFRRLAMPALLYRYFAQMQQALESWTGFLCAGDQAVLVVGVNSTAGRLNPIVIDTPQLIAACAQTVGYEVVELVPFETWPRYGLHAKNSVVNESAVILRKM